MRPRTELELRQRLGAAGIDVGDVEAAVARMLELNLLDDAASLGNGSRSARGAKDSPATLWPGS